MLGYIAGICNRGPFAISLQYLYFGEDNFIADTIAYICNYGSYAISRRVPKKFNKTVFYFNNNLVVLFEQLAEQGFTKLTGVLLLQKF